MYCPGDQRRGEAGAVCIAANNVIPPQLELRSPAYTDGASDPLRGAWNACARELDKVVKHAKLAA